MTTRIVACVNQRTRRCRRSIDVEAVKENQFLFAFANAQLYDDDDDDDDDAEDEPDEPEDCFLTIKSSFDDPAEATPAKVDVGTGKQTKKMNFRRV